MLAVLLGRQTPCRHFVIQESPGGGAVVVAVIMVEVMMIKLLNGDNVENNDHDNNDDDDDTKKGNKSSYRRVRLVAEKVLCSSGRGSAKARLIKSPSQS
jgi:hypothetical protein